MINAPQLLVDLKKLSPKSKIDILDSIVNYTEYLDQAEINTQLRLAAFFAQTCEESAGFTHVDEIGNKAKYHGRGIIQLTGLANYRAYGRKLGIPLEKQPELAVAPANMLRIAVAFWTDHNLNIYADKKDLITITKRINGGLNGYAVRLQYYQKALKLNLFYNANKEV